MFELRWVVRPIDFDPINERRVLQYREGRKSVNVSEGVVFLGGKFDIEWGEWRDVPVVREEPANANGLQRE
jgi:hypothetical protein